MPVSGIGRIFHDSDGYITQVWLNSEITVAQANAMTPYVDMTVAQFTAAGVNDDAELNELLGKHITSATRAIADYVATGSELRGLRQGRIDALVRNGLGSILPVPAAKENAANELTHKYLRMVYAASRVDANMDDTTRFGHVEDAAKGGALNGGLPELFKRWATGSSTYVNGWTTALADTITEIVSVDASGNHMGTTATLPTNWHTSTAYDPVNTI